MEEGQLLVAFSLDHLLVVKGGLLDDLKAVVLPIFLLFSVFVKFLYSRVRGKNSEGFLMFTSMICSVRQTRASFPVGLVLKL